jgi:hypothetical protein
MTFIYSIGTFFLNCLMFLSSMRTDTIYVFDGGDRLSLEEENGGRVLKYLAASPPLSLD